MTRAVRILLFALGGLFILQMSLGQFAGLPVESIFGFVPVEFLSGKLWQIVTYPFLHGSITHLLFNCLILYTLGTELEHRWGTANFLKFYSVCAMGGALLHLLIWGISFVTFPSFSSSLGQVSIIGASGALYGLFMAFGILYGDAPVLVLFMFPMKAKHFVTLLAVIEIVSAVFSGNPSVSSGVAHLVHLGGLITGFLYLRWKGPNLRGGGSGGLFKKKSMNREEIKKRLSVISNDKPERGDKNFPITWN